MLRQPAVAGAFYPGDKVRLASMIDAMLISAEPVHDAVAAVAPHAGYIYSGAAAGALFASIDIPLTVVILGPNHRGVGAPYGIFDLGAWHTPLGDAAIDEPMAAAILKQAGFLRSDTTSHVHEHSIEVQVPFLQYVRPDVKIVPICIGEHNYSRLVELGMALVAAAREVGREVFILASSDMTHYESSQEAGRKDRMAIERMLALDEEGLWRTVISHRISMCGVAPAVAAIAAAREMGATDARLVKYTDSGDVTGDKSAVVGYASVAFVKEPQ